MYFSTPQYGPSNRLMATAVQNNGLQTLGNSNHLLDSNGSENMGIKSEPQDATGNDTLAEQCETEENTPEIDIVINNVVCSFSVGCHLNLREIALNAANVEYRRENGMVTMKLRKPYTTASVWSSGKITCTGATSEPMAKTAARRFARTIQKLGFKSRFYNFKVVNVLGTCSMPFGIKINQFSAKYPKQAEYEPEIHPGVTYRLKEPKATLKIFSTGSITVTAPCISHVASAIEHIFPLVHEFRKERTKEEVKEMTEKRCKNGSRKRKHVSDDETDESGEDWSSHD